MEGKSELKKLVTLEAHAELVGILPEGMEDVVLKDIIEEMIIEKEVLEEEALVIDQGHLINSRILVFPQWALKNTWLEIFDVLQKLSLGLTL
jgi:hypothetical protein